MPPPPSMGLMPAPQSEPLERRPSERRPSDPPPIMPFAGAIGSGATGTPNYIEYVPPVVEEITSSPVPALNIAALPPKGAKKAKPSASAPPTRPPGPFDQLPG